MIRDQIICRTKNKRACADILKLEDPSLDKVIKVCLTHKTIKQQMKVFKEAATPAEDVHAVRKE